MRHPVAALAGFFVPVVLLVTSGASVAVEPTAGAATPQSGARVRTVLGPRTLDAPRGVALDSTGDLFVADTGHCRVVVLPAHVGVFDGLHLRAGRATTLAGGRCRGPGAFGHPSGVAVDGAGDVYVAEATAQRVLEIRHGRSPRVVQAVGTGQPGSSGDGGAGPSARLNEPTDVAVDPAGDLFVADTANCRVRVLPAGNSTLFGQAVRAGHLTTVAGTGVCGGAGHGGPAPAAELWDPVALAVDRGGNLLIADRGDQSVLLVAAHGGTFYGTHVGAGDAAVVVGGSGSYGPYVADGLPATGETAELNDPSGLAVGPSGALFVSDGSMDAIRVVPATTGSLLGRPMSADHLFTAAGAVPVADAAGAGDGTRWVLTTMSTPAGLAMTSSGALVYAERGRGRVREIRPAVHGS